MALSTVTTKGQITIPKAIRSRLRLSTGDKVDFQVNDSGEVVLVPVNKRISDIFGMLSNRASRPVSVDEMNERLRKAMQVEEQ